MFNDILHQPIRTQIMTYLYSVKKASFKDIKTTLNITDGHMSTHMKVFIKNEYVDSNKSFTTGKPLTTYTLTVKGMRNFLEYIDELDRIVNYIKKV
ncbi:transcriptional regulator [Francisella sp. Scap27]|uniref:winged helix-turn-helix domain-containing protein n=1 Tax=Francisella sp. Scap27 TaxID=2589986 RepID=UPI0015C05677|nr:transcriptional regulator [Francisella sp. Scap27]QLE78344.1 transcriptional regulator [Francisella sp. Scap27]